MHEMRRSIVQRAAAALLAGFFLLAGTADVYGLHSCPHHDHGGAETAAEAGPVTAGHDLLLAADDHDGDPATDGPCTCVGSCHGGAAAPVPGVAPLTSVPVATTRRDLLPKTTENRARDRPAYLLPFPNAPPSS
jgi:hypothetical protein